MFNYKLRKLILIFYLSVIAISCKRENEFAFPLIQTGEVTDIDNTGAVFHARITDLSKSEILEYGFVWGFVNDPDIRSSKITVANTPETGFIDIKVSSDFVNDTIYYVRAFIRNDRYTTYGKNVSFRSKGSLAPEIIDFNPKEGTNNTTVTISGKNFSGGITGNVVMFGRAEAEVIEAGAEKLIVSLPSDLKFSGKVHIFIKTADKTAKSSSTFDLLGCEILNVSPSSLIGGDIIYVKAENLSSTPMSNSLKIGNKESEVFGISGDTLIAYVPYNVNAGKNEVSLSVNGKTCYSNDSLLIRNPWKAINSNMPFTTSDDACFSIQEEGFLLVYSNFWKFNAGSSSWTKCADLPGESRVGCTGFSIGGKGYICFGVENGFYYTYLYEYDPGENKWTRKADFPGTGRVNPVVFVIGEKAFVGLGRNENGPLSLNDFWVYDPVSDRWSRVSDYPGDWNDLAVGYSVGNKGYVGLGRNSITLTYGREFWEYEPSSDKWTRISDFQGTGRVMLTGFSIRNYGYFGTGWNHNDYYILYDDFWRYDPIKDKIIRLADIPFEGRYKSLSFVIGDKAYIFSGHYRNFNLIEFNPN